MKFSKENIDLLKIKISFIESYLIDNKKYKLYDTNSKFDWLIQGYYDSRYDDIIVQEQLLFVYRKDLTDDQKNFLDSIHNQDEMIEIEDNLFNSTNQQYWFYCKPIHLDELNTTLIIDFVNFKNKKSGFDKLSDQSKIELNNFYIRNKSIFSDHKVKIADIDLKNHTQNLDILS